MPNPTGINSANAWDGLTATEPYGSVKRRLELARAAPTPPVPGGNAPQNAKRRAQRGYGPAQPEQAAAPQPVAPEISYPVFLAQAWQEIAALPGVSDTVQQMSFAAQRAAGLSD